ncbi:MAG: amidohydrolase [Candidatus Krumholzibacteriia bacterium]
MNVIIAVCALLGAADATAGGGGSAPAPELILHGGRIITVAGDAALAARPSGEAPSAVAVAGGRILAVGDDASILALANARTRRVDLGGAVVVPGFCDGHAHLRGLGWSLTQIDLMGTSSATEAVERVRQAAAAAADGSWLQGRGWDQNDWEVPVFPDRQLLDAAVGDRPVLLKRVDGHAAWVSSAALRIAGIDADTPDPAGGAILRDAAGLPTGILVDRAADLVAAAIPADGPEEIRRQIHRATEHCLRHGVTGVHEAGATWDVLEVYRSMADAGELGMRVYAMLEDDPATLDRGLARGPWSHPGGRLSVRAVKLYADGALGSRGALLLADYRDDPGNRGLLVTPREHLRDVMARAREAGFQVCTHAIGDGANRLVLDLYAEVLGEAAGGDHRWRIEHAQIIHPDDLPRFAALNVLAAMQPLHCTSDLDWAPDRLGEDRLAGAYAWRSLLDLGTHVSFGTDFPVEVVDPLAGLYAARTRMHQDGTPAGGWRPHERLDGATALELYTAAPAHASFQEDVLGRIVPGQRADLVVLGGDPVDDEPAALLTMPVLMTLVDGAIVHDAREAGR